MNEIQRPSFDDFDEIHDPREEDSDFAKITRNCIDRRAFVGGGLGIGLAAFVAGSTALRPIKAVAESRLAFDQLRANTLDTITVPDGYEWYNVVSWGQPLWSRGAPFSHSNSGTAADQALAFGDNNDGMALFVQGDRSVLVVNNEYTNLEIMHSHLPDGKPATDDDIEKGMLAHGVSVMEIDDSGGKWEVVMDSEFNRRITPQTEMEITGPARGHELLRTPADPTGTRSRGTWNNCGNGRTPWGTYLACEENFNGYFSSSGGKDAIPAPLRRYGVRDKDWGYGWSKIDDRFDVTKVPNEPNRAGYVVEIDPFDRDSMPRKRTALGRFKHENAEVVLANSGHVVVYMGDDERGEFLYRFVSRDKLVQGGDNSELLSEGRLYVAKFDDRLNGRWIELTPQNTGMPSMAEICVHTRQAGSAVGATTMDRPEWVASNPHRAEVYCALTNNKNRGKKTNAGGDEQPVGGPNPREGNIYGQIVRWVPDGGDHTADGFTWDLFAMAGNPAVKEGLNRGSSNITRDNMFNSPDGIAFDASGLLWIQTDGKYSNEGDFAQMGNNQMLCADPDTGEIRRFLIGPRGCEVTGITWSADGRTMFVGVQHPGEDGSSHFPEGGSARPRSSVVAIRRTDGRVLAG